MNKRVVIAIGGNALVENKDKQSEKDQYRQVKKTCASLVELIEEAYEIVITHGNGPQVGFILQKSELAFQEQGLDRTPIDTADAQTQGSIGFYLQQNILNLIKERNYSEKVATIITQVLVNKKDPSFNNPSKPIGSFYPKEEALRLHRKFGWAVEEDAGRGWRRVVPSPEPIDVLEKEIILDLLKRKTIVVACGGGGIPTVLKNKHYEGVEAVIDKDKASALLANQIKADQLIITTAVNYVYINFNTPEQKKLTKISVTKLKQYIKENHFARGSMLPKIEAVIKFLEAGGKKAIITSPNNLAKAIRGESGTHITL